MQSGKVQEALEPLGEAIQVLEDVRQKQPRSEKTRRSLCLAYKERGRALAKLGRHKEGLPDWDRAFDLVSKDRRLDIQVARAVALARAGEHARATAEANTLGQDKEASRGHFYDLACVFGLAVKAVRQDRKLTQSDQDKRSEEYGARAVKLLRQVVAQGFPWQHIETDSDLDSVRQRADFQKLRTEQEKKQKSGSK
jgi:hypothetical protein